MPLKQEESFSPMHSTVAGDMPSLEDVQTPSAKQTEGAHSMEVPVGVPAAAPSELRQRKPALRKQDTNMSGSSARAKAKLEKAKRRKKKAAKRR